MPSKYEIVRDLIAHEVSWSGGIDRPWQEEALVSPWFLDRLAIVVAQAPQELIMDLITACQENAGETQEEAQ